MIGRCPYISLESSMNQTRTNKRKFHGWTANRIVTVVKQFPFSLVCVCVFFLLFIYIRSSILYNIQSSILYYTLSSIRYFKIFSRFFLLLRLFLYFFSLKLINNFFCTLENNNITIRKTEKEFCAVRQLKSVYFMFDWVEKHLIKNRFQLGTSTKR